MCSIHDAQLTVTEARADTTTLYLDVVHDEPGTLKSYTEAPVTAQMLLDSCPAAPPPVEGAVWRDWQSPSTATIALSDLPDGELDIVLYAFGAETEIPLVKRDKTVGYLTLEQRRDYMEIPGNPEQDIPPMSGLRIVECPRLEVEQ